MAHFRPTHIHTLCILFRKLFLFYVFHFLAPFDQLCCRCCYVEYCQQLRWGITLYNVCTRLPSSLSIYHRTLYTQRRCKQHFNQFPYSIFRSNEMWMVNLSPSLPLLVLFKLIINKPKTMRRGRKKWRKQKLSHLPFLSDDKRLREMLSQHDFIKSACTHEMLLTRKCDVFRFLSLSAYVLHLIAYKLCGTAASRIRLVY